MNFFNKNIFSLEDKYFALDLSDLSVKTFQLERNGSEDRIRSYATMDIPAGYMEDGKIIEAEKTAAIIKEAIRRSSPRKINTKKVVCSVCESKAFLRTISIPKVNPEEAGEAIKWELEANIPLTSDQVYFDWQFLGESQGKQNVLTVAVSRDIIDSIIGVLKMANLEVYGLELESIATSRSLIPSNASSEDIYLIVDIGARRSSFIVLEGAVPYFTSSIPFSSESITDTISGRLGINKQEAEKIKIGYGIEKSPENSLVFQAVKPLLEYLSSEIEKTLDFYQTIAKGSGKVKKILLCGGGSNLRGVLPYLATRLSREVAIGDPWINLNFNNSLPIIDKETSVRYSTAIGLALKKMKYGNQY